MADVTVQGEFPGSGGPTRLDLTSHPSVRTVLDGAWWPRTRDSTSELAGLVAALDAKGAVVGLIMLTPRAGSLAHDASRPLTAPSGSYRSPIWIGESTSCSWCPRIEDDRDPRGGDRPVDRAR